MTGWVVGAAIIDDAEHPRAVLAARRTRPPELAGRWEFPGGKVEPGETPERALVRELDEELGVTATRALPRSPNSPRTVPTQRRSTTDGQPPRERPATERPGDPHRRPRRTRHQRVRFRGQHDPPRIDEVAAAGRRVDRCFCTNALCTPSRASILTGTHSHVNEVTTLETPIDASQPTFVSLLRAAGYRTGIVGKWHLGEGAGHDPQDFDHWEVLRGQGEYFDPQILSAAGVRTVPGHATDVITDLSLAWLESLSGEGPWCLLVHHKAPHRSWEPDEAHRGMYANREIPRPDTFDDDYATRTLAARHATMRIADHLTPADLKQEPPDGLDAEALAVWKYQRYMEDYLACVASVDDNVGRVIDWLRDRGEFDDTLLMYSSDQGFFLGDHGRFDTRFMYEESIRLPLLVSCPRMIEPGPPLAQLVTNVDFAQTILDAAGVEPHPRMQGVSFWPQLTGSTQPTRDAFYYRYYENDDADHHALAHYGIRDDRYKLIYFYGDGLGLPGSSERVFPPAWELYDLITDPAELRNVYDDPRYAEVRERLKARLWELQHELGDQPHPSQPVPDSITDRTSG